ncbi:hypothetical protein ACI7YP_000849 [Campylobacter coli]
MNVFDSIYRDSKNNLIYGDLNIQRNINIDFGDGENNIVFIARVATSVKISFKGNNSLVFLADWCHLGGKGIVIYSNSVCYLGKCTYIGEATIWVSECKNFIIGDNCLFSSNIWFRTADQHMIYNMSTNTRINTGKSIYIGDHVWGGYGTSYLKGCFIASGSIIGNGSIVSGKIFRSNTINAGVPCKEIKRNIFWIADTPDRSDFDRNTLEGYKFYNNEEFKYCYDRNNFLSPYTLEEKINSFLLASEKLDFLYNTIYMNTNKNRFSYNKRNMKNHFIRARLYTTAKARIRNHLAYKLGYIMIKNSKSFFGYIRMPYILLIVTLLHKIQVKKRRTFKDKFPPLESYPDYKEALKEKECFAYKLGEALIQAHKDWYKGGYIRFLLKDIFKLKSEI